MPYVHWKMDSEAVGKCLGSYSVIIITIYYENEIFHAELGLNASSSSS